MACHSSVCIVCHLLRHSLFVHGLTLFSHSVTDSVPCYALHFLRAAHLFFSRISDWAPLVGWKKKKMFHLPLRGDHSAGSKLGPADCCFDTQQQWYINASNNQPSDYQILIKNSLDIYFSYFWENFTQFRLFLCNIHQTLQIIHYS